LERKRGEQQRCKRGSKERERDEKEKERESGMKKKKRERGGRERRRIRIEATNDALLASLSLFLLSLSLRSPSLFRSQAQ
jgi:hypothetical protein